MLMNIANSSLSYTCLHLSVNELHPLFISYFIKKKWGISAPPCMKMLTAAMVHNNSFQFSNWQQQAYLSFTTGIIIFVPSPESFWGFFFFFV